MLRAGTCAGLPPAKGTVTQSALRRLRAGYDPVRAGMARLWPARLAWAMRRLCAGTCRPAAPRAPRGTFLACRSRAMPARTGTWLARSRRNALCVTVPAADGKPAGAFHHSYLGAVVFLWRCCVGDTRGNPGDGAAVLWQCCGGAMCGHLRRCVVTPGW